MDRFESLQAFVAVCEAGGFTPAARRLGLSASAITRQVAALEDRLGTRLLHRTTRAMHLTEAGERYLDRARRILTDMAEADELARGEQAKPQGRLSLTAPLLLGRLHVAPLLDRLLSQNPGLKAELHLSDSWINLIESGYDLAVRIGHLADSSLVARKLGQVRRVLVASPAYLAARGAPRHPDDLAGHDTIAFTGVGTRVDWMLAMNGHAHRVAVTPAYVSNSGDAAIGRAVTGGGIVNALSYQVRTAIADGRLVEVLKDFSPTPLPIQAVYPSSRLLPARVRAFIDLIDVQADWDLT